MALLHLKSLARHGLACRDTFKGGSAWAALLLGWLVWGERARRHGAVDDWWRRGHAVGSGGWGTILGWWAARLDGHLGETCAWDDTLLAAVHLGAKCLGMELVSAFRKLDSARFAYPSVVVFMKHANKLAGLEFKLVFHARLEFELYTVNIVRAAGDRNGSSSRDLSSACVGSGSAFYRAVALRVDTFSPVVTLLGDNGSIAEGVLGSVGCSVGCVTRSQVGKELSDRAKAEARCGGGSLCARATESVTVAAEPVHRDWGRGGKSTLLVMFLKTALALLATPAEKDQSEDEGEAKDDTHCKTSFCATGHASVLLGISNRAVSGAERGASNHARSVVGSLGTVGVSYISGLDRRGGDVHVHGRGCSR